MTFDLEFSLYVEAMDLGKVLEFQNFILGITEDKDSWSVSWVKNDPVGPSSVEKTFWKLFGTFIKLFQTLKKIKYHSSRHLLSSGSSISIEFQRNNQ